MRPCKPRRIGALPSCRRYGPQDGVPEGENRIGLDMLEALRLVDAEGMPQDQAATVMEVSAPTLCRILGEARRQVATALCQGRALVIEGGNVMLCENSGGQRHGYGPHGPHGHGGRRQGCGAELGTGRHCGNGALPADREELGRGPGHGQGMGRKGAGACRRGRMAGQTETDELSRDGAASENGAA